VAEWLFDNRFAHFTTGGSTLRIMDQIKCTDLLLRFVHMSDKKDQQKTIDEIKNVLLKFGAGKFSTWLVEPSILCIYLQVTPRLL
jgi:hypothetical protein